MGSTYSNITFKGADRARIIQALEARKRTAYVGPDEGGYVVVYDAESDRDPDATAELAQSLGGELGAVAFAASLYDEDVFIYALSKDGKQLDAYDSQPGYFDGGDSPASGGNVAVLCATLGGDAQAVERILRAPREEYTFESRRHAALAAALGLPGHSVNLGYDYVYQGDAEELEDEMTHVGEEEDGGGAGAGGGFDLFGGGFPGMPGRQSMMEHMQATGEAMRNPAHGYYPALLKGDAAAVRALFAGEPVIDDPLAGHVDGAGVDALVAAAGALFAQGAATAAGPGAEGNPLAAYMESMLGGHASYTATGMLETPERTVSHGQILSAGGGQPAMLGAACVWERDPGGGFRALRAYWSPSAAKGQRGERAPVVEPNPDLHLPDVITAHLKALADDDMAALLGTYDTRCLQPVPWVDGADTVRGQYGARLGEQGAVVLQPCTVTESGDACAVEYVTTKWDGAEVPPQAGLVIFRLAGGRICHVHVFGDFAPSPLAGLGGLGGLGGGGALLSPEMMQEAMQQMMQQLGGSGGMGGLGGFGGLGGGGGMPNLQELLGGGGGMLGGGGGMDEMMKGLQEMLGGGGMPGAGGMPGGVHGFPELGGFGHGDDDEDEGHEDGPPPAAPKDPPASA